MSNHFLVMSYLKSKQFIPEPIKRLDIFSFFCLFSRLKLGLDFKTTKLYLVQKYLLRMMSLVMNLVLL